MSAWLWTCIAVLTGILWIKSKRRNPDKIFGIYTQPGKWYHLKYLTFLILLKIRRIKFLKKPLTDEERKTTEKELEKLQPLSSHEKAFDAVFFQAVTQDGYYLATGTERRHGGIINGLCYIATPKHGLLKSAKLPKTELIADPVSMFTMESYSAEGICFTPTEPMKTWRVKYVGKMKSKANPEKLFEVTFDAEWIANSPYFMFDTQMDEHVLAKAIARESWSRDYFKTLESAHQSHYEQMGILKGTVTIDKEVHHLVMDAFRDHSYAHKRDWTLMHRYIFNMLYLEDGTRAAVGVISQPCTTSHLEMGYIVTKNKQVFPITSCDLLLYQFAENGTPPKTYGFSFTANNEVYEVHAEAEYDAIHFVGSNIEARMIERFVKYTCNGVRGRGISEWNYYNKRAVELHRQYSLNSNEGASTL